MPQDVAELVAAAKHGDREAFDELVRVTYADTYTLAYRLTGNEEDARDVVQEAYLRAFRGLRRFRGDAQFSTWMYRITANCANTLLAKRTKHRHAVLDEADPIADDRPAVDPQLQADASALRNRLTEALEDLLLMYQQAPHEFADGAGRILARLVQGRSRGDFRLENELRRRLRT